MELVLEATGPPCGGIAQGPVRGTNKGPARVLQSCCNVATPASPRAKIYLDRSLNLKKQGPHRVLSAISICDSHYWRIPHGGGERNAGEKTLARGSLMATAAADLRFRGEVRSVCSAPPLGDYGI